MIQAFVMNERVDKESIKVELQKVQLRISR